MKKSKMRMSQMPKMGKLQKPKPKKSLMPLKPGMKTKKMTMPKMGKTTYRRKV